MTKKRGDNAGIVYSTDPGYKFENEHVEMNTLSAAEQNLRVRLDTKQRAGKAVTLITGFVGKSEEMEELGRKLKSFCGTGGSVKDGEILVQGDNRDRIMQWLEKNGYKRAKKV
jgi:translation initiation factor 1